MVFIPTKNHEQVLYRFDLAHISSTRLESLQTANRYSRLMQLNYQELGYLIKSVLPLDLSGTLLSEGKDKASYMEFTLKIYKNMIKMILKRL